MRRLLLAVTLGLAAPSAFALSVKAHRVVAVADTVSSDTLAARSIRAEAFFFDGKSAELRALADSEFSAMLTDEAHSAFLMQIMTLGGADATGEWEALEFQGMKAYRRPYTLAGMAARFVVVFNADGQIAGLALAPEG